MKTKLFIFGLLSVAGVLGVVGQAAAFFWKHHRWNKYQSVIVCRPYNAFTPMCYGNITCDGCCPSPCFAAAALPSLQPWCAPTFGGFDPCLAGAPSFGAGGMSMPTVPAATPSPHLPGPVAHNGAANVHLANFQAGYQPNYHPMPNYYPGFYPTYPMHGMPSWPTSPYHQSPYGYPAYPR